MASIETATGIPSFFNSYREAFERFDAAALAEFFAYPCHITGDSDDIVLASVTTKQDYLRLITQFLKLYRAAGVTSGRILDLSSSTLSPRLALCRIHWEVTSATGRILYDFHAAYTLVNIDDAWRIAAIAHDELPHLTRCLNDPEGGVQPA